MTLTAAVGALAFLWLAVFQTLLALGAPLGHLAGGGASGRLSAGKRLASFAVVPLALFGAGCFLQAAGVLRLLPEGSLRLAFWGFAGLFALSFVGNAMSSSRVERLHGVPLTLVLCGASLVQALWG